MRQRIGTPLGIGRRVPLPQEVWGGLLVVGDLVQKVARRVWILGPYGKFPHLRAVWDHRPADVIDVRQKNAGRGNRLVARGLYGDYLELRALYHDQFAGETEHSRVDVDQAVPSQLTQCEKELPVVSLCHARVDVSHRMQLYARDLAGQGVYDGHRKPLVEGETQAHGSGRER